MSALQPTHEQSYPAPSAPSLQSQKPQRVLACVLCQQRKIKCNRKFPCANCIRSGTSCVPATLTARRRRRRFPERELLDRVRKYEDLLLQNNVKFEPLRTDPAAKENASPKAEDTNDSDEEQPEAAGVKAEPPYPSDTAKDERAYRVKNFWHAMSKWSRDPDDDSDSSQDDVLEATVKRAWDQLYTDNDRLLLSSRETTVDLSTLHPDPVQIFRLWQIYLDNVDPLLKVTYTPVLQGRIIEAASNISSISPALEALMFSIYCAAIQSLAGDDCHAIFGSSEEDLLTAYQFGCEQALLNCGFLRSSDYDCLTALFLYLISAGHRTDPRSLSSTLGVAIRIAQRMGLHSESANAECPPLEAEMRRRLWWSLVLFDTRIGEMADYKAGMLAAAWDCRTPLNVNDCDLRQELKEPPAVQGRSTEALFAVVRSELGDFVRHAAFYLDFTSLTSKSIARDGQRGHIPEGSGLATLERKVEDKYLQFCDPENPLQFMTIWMTRGYLAKCRLIEHYWRYSPSSAQQTEVQRDAALSHAFAMLDSDTKIKTSPLTKGYLWLIQFYFPFPAYLHIVQELKRRPVGERAEQAWEVMSANYDARFALVSTEDNPLIAMLARIVSQAWESREATFGESGQPVSPPRIVSGLRRYMARMAPNAQKADTEQPNAALAMDMDRRLPVSMPTAFGGHGLLGGMGGQDSYAGTGPGVFPYPNFPGESPLDVDVAQLNWGVMDWNLGARRG